MERIKQILTDFISTNPFNLLNLCSNFKLINKRKTTYK